MSLDIDLKNYAGERTDLAAVDQTDTNSYQQEAEEYSVPRDFGDKPVDSDVVEEVEKPDSNPQAGNFRALRDEVNRIKAERETEKHEHQLQLDMLRANLAQVNKANEPLQKQMFDGMSDDDVPNVAEIRKEWQVRETNYQARLEELQVQQAHPDYAEVIEKYAVPLAKSDPTFVDLLKKSSNPAQFAYQQGKREQRIQDAELALKNFNSAPQINPNAQRIVDNSKKPGTLSQAGGQSALSKADYFATMSDKEFMKMASRNLDSI